MKTILNINKIINIVVRRNQISTIMCEPNDNDYLSNKMTFEIDINTHSNKKCCG